MKLGDSLARKIVERHKERQRKLEKMERDAVQKSLHFAAQTDMAVPMTEAQLEAKVFALLNSKPGSPIGSRPNTGAGAGAGGSRPTSSPAAKFPPTSMQGIAEEMGGSLDQDGDTRPTQPKKEVSQQRISQRPPSAGKQQEEKQHQQQETGQPLSPRAPMLGGRGGLGKQPSLQKLVDLGKANRQASFRGEAPGTARTVGTVDTVEEERQRVKDTTRKDRRKQSSTDKLNESY